jgi:hypothetical protein
MKNYASIPTAEKEIVTLFSKTNEIKVYLHIELPPQRKGLKQSTWSPQDIQMKLESRLKPIDAHPKVVSKEYPNRFPWIVTKN